MAQKETMADVIYLIKRRMIAGYPKVVVQRSRWDNRGRRSLVVREWCGELYVMTGRGSARTRRYIADMDGYIAGGTTPVIYES